jgi:hypothetical protein
MAHKSTSDAKQLADLGDGTSVWWVHVEALREQDVNARVMSPSKFERLVENIRQSGHLESFPLVHQSTNAAGNAEFHIISGHHRTRAARAAGLHHVPVIVLGRDLTPSQIKAKQLAHNALAGTDDREILGRIYEQIEDLQARLETGLTDQELAVDLPTVPIDEVSLGLRFELVNLLFLPRAFERFTELLDTLETNANVLLGD